MNRNRSILDIEGGNIIRQIDNALEQVMFNINDESTDFKAREIKVSIRITPNKKRNELTVGYKVVPKLSPKLNEPITLINTKEFEPATGEFLGSKLPPIVVGSRLQEKREVVNANNKFQGAIE